MEISNNIQLVRGFVKFSNCAIDPNQVNVIENLFYQFKDKHDALKSDGKMSSEGSLYGYDKKDKLKELKVYNIEKYEGKGHITHQETLSCLLNVVQSENACEIEPICKWRSDYHSPSRNLFQDITFDLNNPSSEIPKDTSDIPLYSKKIEILKIAGFTASTIYFAYKAYKEIRKIYEESLNKSDTRDSHARGLGDKKPFVDDVSKEAPDKSKEQASKWRALGYSAAAICSGAFTFYNYQALSVLGKE